MIPDRQTVLYPEVQRSIAMPEIVGCLICVDPATRAIDLIGRAVVDPTITQG